MRKIITLVLLFCLCSYAVFAQNTYSVKGIVADTSARIKLINATITIMNSKDSILYKFTRSKTDGSFSINNMGPGNFLMLITYREYADNVRPFTLDAANPVHDFGQIDLTLKAALLKEVVIRGSAITIKGDTTVFNASSYKVQANARVEDLLKQFPGIEVDQDGKIKAQGKIVEKVLVDGEEFFTADPTLVTRNIRADMVKSVELYDDKSDQAKLTGQEDPNKIKTLNVVLKDEAKNSYFGKVEGGEGQNNYYQGTAMYNNFKPKKKWAVYGLISNTSKAGLSSADNAKIGTQDQGATYTGQGLPLTKKAGLHYDTKYDKDKQTLNLNYVLNSQGVDAIVNTLSQNNLPGNAQLGVQDQNRSTTNLTHQFSGVYTWTISPQSSLRVNSSLRFANNLSNDANNTSTSTINDLKLNNSNRVLNNDVNSSTGYITLSYFKRLKKAGRSLSIFSTGNFSQSKGSRYLYSANSFYNAAGGTDSTMIIDQYKPVDSKNTSTSLGATWSEPISKGVNLSVNYRFGMDNSSNDQESYNKSALGKYDIRDNTFSNNYDVDQFTNYLGTSLSYSKAKSTYNLGSDVGVVKFKQTDLNTNTIYNRHFVNWRPYALYSYRYSQSKSFSLEYSGSTSQPSFDQIQPLKVNTDPLNIIVGNAALKPQFTHTIYTNYLSAQQLSGRSISLTAYGYLYVNRIANNTTTDAVGKTVTQYINVDKNSNYIQFDATMGNRLKSGINMSSNFNMTGQNIYNYINSVLNKTTYYTFNFYSTLSKTVVGKYDFSVRTGPGYNLQYSSLQPDLKNSGWVYRIEPTFNLFLPGKTQLNAVVSYLYRQKSIAFPESYQALICNTTLSKKFLKKDNLILSVYGNDLLNQNKGFTRSNPYANYFTLTRYNTIRRYYMVQLSWDFMKPKPVPAQK